MDNVRLRIETVADLFEPIYSNIDSGVVHKITKMFAEVMVSVLSIAYTISWMISESELKKLLACLKLCVQTLTEVLYARRGTRYPKTYVGVIVVVFFIAYTINCVMHDFEQKQLLPSSKLSIQTATKELSTRYPKMFAEVMVSVLFMVYTINWIVCSEH